MSEIGEVHIKRSTVLLVYVSALPFAHLGPCHFYPLLQDELHPPKTEQLESLRKISLRGLLVWFLIIGPIVGEEGEPHDIWHGITWEASRDRYAAKF